MADTENIGNIEEEIIEKQEQDEIAGNTAEETEIVDESNENAEKNENTKQNKKDLKKLRAELEEKNEEYDALYDKYLRVNAEYDNFRKRTAKEKEGIYSDAVIDVLSNILPALDNLERAVQFADSSEPEKVSEGVKMIHAQFINSFAKIGVEEIKAEGEQFDPEIHNAVFHEEDEGKPNNTVTEVLQKGYIRGDKVIRPAMVKVVN